MLTGETHRAGFFPQREKKLPAFFLSAPYVRKTAGAPGRSFGDNRKASGVPGQAFGDNRKVSGAPGQAFGDDRKASGLNILAGEWARGRKEQSRSQRGSRPAHGAGRTGR